MAPQIIHTYFNKPIISVFGSDYVTLNILLPIIPGPLTIYNVEIPYPVSNQRMAYIMGYIITEQSSIASTPGTINACQ